MAAPAKCARCNKTAYATEQVKMNALTFHTKCFTCWSCQSPLARGSQKEGSDGFPYCAKCYAANFGPKGFRGGAVDGSVSVTEHKWDTQSHVKDPNYGKAPAAAPASGGKKFCSSCGAALPGAAAKFCASCGAAQ